MDKILTIIVPSYNMENYLEKDLNSLIVSENYLNYIEVLVINDGSKDATLKIAQSFEQKYPGVFFAIDKSNGNYGSCINKGLELAKGKFIKILDADDSFDTKEFEKLLKQIMESEQKNENVQLFLTDYQLIDSNGDRGEIVKPLIKENHVFQFPENVDNSFIINIAHHSIVYRTSFLRDMQYEQCEKVSYSDTEWFILPLLNIKTIKYLPLTVYLYLVGREGQSIDPKIFIKNINSFITVAKDLILKTNKMKNLCSDKNLELVNFKTFYYLTYFYKPFLMSADDKSLEQIKEFDKWLLENEKELYNRLDKATLKKLPIRYIHNFRCGINSFKFRFTKSIYRLFQKKNS